MAALFVALAALASFPARASLIGASVTGTMNHGVNPVNDFDPGQGGSVPAGVLNLAGPTVTVASPAVEFGYLNQDGKVTADFDANSLNITIFFNGISPLHFTLKSSAFVGQTLSEISDGFPNGGMTGSLVGDTLTVDWAGNTVFGSQTQSVVFNFSAPAGPGPAGVPLPAAVYPGLVLGAVVVRRVIRAGRVG